MLRADLNAPGLLRRNIPRSALRLLLIIALLAAATDATAAKRKRQKRPPSPTVTLPSATVDPDGYADNLADEDSNETDELQDDDDDFEPTDEQSRTHHYVPKDGRNPLVISAGFAAVMRMTAASAADGTPPFYEGTLSPGAALHFSLYPFRFKEGGGAARDLGINGRFVFALMSATVVDAPTQPVRTDLFYSVQVGVALRHVFGERASAIAFGAEIGLSVDAMRVSPDLLLPAAAFVSPRATLLLEIPLAGKYLVWASRVGVLPVTAVTAAQVQQYGTRKLALGLDVESGLRSTLWNDILYMEATALVTHYWHEYEGRGSDGFLNVQARDLLFGVTASIGVTY